MMTRDDLDAIKRMCDIIVNNRFGNAELDSIALWMEHHPDIKNTPATNVDIEHWSENCIAVVSPTMINFDGEHQILGIAKVEGDRIYSIEIDVHCPEYLVPEVRQVCLNFISTFWQ